MPIEEMKETQEIREGSDAEALETEAAVQGTGFREETTNDIPKSIADILQLSESEKQVYMNIGNTVEHMPVEGRIIGYKKGSCNERLIPIHN